jgi:hypothetical protein
MHGLVPKDAFGDHQSRENVPTLNPFHIDTPMQNP